MSLIDTEQSYGSAILYFCRSAIAASERNTTTIQAK